MLPQRLRISIRVACDLFPYLPPGSTSKYNELVSPETDFTKSESYFGPSLFEAKSVQTGPSPLKVHLNPVLSVRLQFL